LPNVAVIRSVYAGNLFGAIRLVNSKFIGKKPQWHIFSPKFSESPSSETAGTIEKSRGVQK